MKIAVATRYLHRAGGIETYLESLLPELVSRGHEVAIWHEFTPVPDAECFTPASVTSRPLDAAVKALGAAGSIRPDVVFLQGLSDPGLEAQLATMAPLVVLLHAYNGTCVSETKTYAFPNVQPCSRPLGAGCLLRYYPRRCGGWSPVTMLTSYAKQQRRRSVLRSCASVATLSAHMRHEAIAQGVSPDRAVHLPAFTPASQEQLQAGCCGGSQPALQNDTGRTPNGKTHLVFAGRMERLKGGQVFLDALDHLRPSLRENLHLTFAGDGRERGRWEQQAAHIARGEFEVRFVGWLSPAERSALFAAAHLLVVPSIWPEPLGLVGLEAGAAGLPAIAFDVGGIREWLIDGVTGRLARLTSDGSASLARALTECLESPSTLTEWGSAARAHSRRRTVATHVEALESLLARAICQPGHAVEAQPIAAHGHA